MLKVLYKTPDCIIGNETLLLQILQKNYSCCSDFNIRVRSRSIGCWLREKKTQNPNPLTIMAQYGWQNTVACVGKWLQSNVWNHLSSGRVWKMTALCILQKSLLIDFIYLEKGGTVTDGGDNWEKKKVGFYTLSWHPVLVRVVGTFWEVWAARYILPLL